MYATAPEDLGFQKTTGAPKDGASATRTDLGIFVLRVAAGKYVRTSDSTSRASVVRLSNMVNAIIETHRDGLWISATLCTDRVSRARPSRA